MTTDEVARLRRRLEALEEVTASLQRQLRVLEADLTRYEAGAPSRVADREAGASVGEGAATPREPVAGPSASDQTDVGVGLTARLRERYGDLEFWVGGRGLLLLGVLALVLAVAFFLKEAIQRGWIGPAARVLGGAALGVAVAVLGDRIRARGYRTYGLWLAAGGFGAIYLSIWAAAAFHSLISSGTGFVLMIAVVAAAAFVGVLRRAEAFVALAAFGGYLAPLLLRVETPSNLFGLGYLVVLTAAGLWLAQRMDWRYLAVLAVAGGSLMTLPGSGGPHLHGLYLAGLTGGALTAARRRGWPGVSALAVVLVWIVYALGRADWAITGMTSALYAGAIWLASLPAWVGLEAWVERSGSIAVPAGPRRAGTGAELPELAGVLVTLLPPVLFYAFAVNGVADSDFARTRDAVAVLLGLGLGAMYLGFAAYGPEGRGGLAGRAWRSGLGYGFWLLAPAVVWSDAALVRAWLAEGLALSAAGILLDLRMARAAGLGALALSVITHSGAVGQRPEADRAFIGGWSLNGLGSTLGLAGWGVAAARVRAPARWEPALRPIALLVAAALFLGWGTVEIHRFYEQLGDPGRWSLASDLSISGFWMIYAAALLLTGLTLNRKPVRWAGLTMALIAAVKVFFYDLSVLSQAYRIASFVLLAIVLLSLSYGYQRLRNGSESEPDQAG